MNTIEDIRKFLIERVANLPKRDDIESKYTCNVCRDLRHLFNDKGEAYPCKCNAKIISEQMLHESGIGSYYKSKNFSNYIADNKELYEAKNKAINYCIKFKEKPDYNKSFLLSGQSGTGKSHLGIAITLNLIESNIGCRYIDYRKFITEMRQNVMNLENYNKLMRSYQNVRALYIDDFLKGKIGDSDINYIFELLNYRYQNLKPTIISTEKTIDELKEYDEAIASRIIEMCGGINGNIVIFKNKYMNYRLRGTTITT